MVLLGEILLMPPCFQLETPIKVVTVIVSDQIREAQILRKVFASVFSKKAEFSFFFFCGLLLNFYVYTIFSDKP